MSDHFAELLHSRIRNYAPNILVAVNAILVIGTHIIKWIGKDMTYSARIDRSAENVCTPAIVVSELEVGGIQRQILAANFMKRPTTPCLKINRKPSMVCV